MIFAPIRTAIRLVVLVARLGGKDTGVNNDQFHGYLDVAWVHIG